MEDLAAIYLYLVLFGFFCAYIGRWVWLYIHRLSFSLISKEGSDAIAFHEVGGKKFNIALYEGGNYVTIRSAKQVERRLDSAAFEGTGWDAKEYRVNVKFYDTTITVSVMAEDQSYYYTEEFNYSSLAQGILSG